MNSKQRVLCAVALGEPNRPPLDVHPNPFVAERLQREWGIADYREMLLRLGSDIVDLRSTVNPHYRGPGPLLQTHPDGTRENFWGWRTRVMQTACGPEEIFSEFVLANAKSVPDLAAHRWPSPDWFDFSDFAERLKPWEDFAVMATGASIWQHPIFLRSLEAFSMDLLHSATRLRVVPRSLKFAFWSTPFMPTSTATGGFQGIEVASDSPHRRFLRSPPRSTRRPAA